MAMTQPAFPVEPTEHDKFEDQSSTAPVFVRPANPTSLESALTACRLLAIFGTWAGRGMFVLGLIGAAGQFVLPVGSGLSDRPAWASAALSSAAWVLAWGLAGWGVAALSRVTAAAIGEYLERVARVSDHLSNGAAQGIALLERIAVALEQRGGSASSGPARGPERAVRAAEIRRATCAQEWAGAETLLKEFQAEFPDDPDLSTWKDELVRARDAANKDRLTRLDAAREVNDPEGVLEIYLELTGSLNDDHRTELESDVARWFMSLIQRRLRTGKVQPDVVQLAARFAETFAATVEGASVRASLPMLRRTIGLCPRCAQPYTGIADACPRCLKVASSAISSAHSSAETDRPE